MQHSVDYAILQRHSRNIQKYPTWNVAGAREVFEHTVQAIYARRGIALQRNIMRKIFARPEVLQNIATLPFEWILSTFEDATVEYGITDASQTGRIV